MQAPSKPERNLTVVEQADEFSAVHLKSADSERRPPLARVDSLPPPGVMSPGSPLVKLGTLLSLLALFGVTCWGAFQLYREPAPLLARGVSDEENLSPEADVARVFARCAAGDVAGARALARSFVRRYPTSPDRARVEQACRTSGKVPD